jgi:hypothetical protein
MKRLGSLTILGCVAATACSATAAGAATGPLQIPGATGKIPAQVGFPLDATWAPPVLPGPAPPSTAGRYQLRRPLSDGATCTQDVLVVGVAVKPSDRPVLADGTLRLHPAGSLLPLMRVERHGAAGALRWFAGPLSAMTGTAGLRPPLQQGIAVLPAPSWATRGGRSLIVVRVGLDANVQNIAANGTFTPPTAAEATECFTPLRAQLGPRLRTLLRAVSVQRRA